MSRQPVFAYSIAGIAVAIAIVVVAASTLGLSGGSSEAGPALAAGGVPFVQGGAPDAGSVEYVYVDEPRSARSHDDDDDERDEHDEHDERGHEERRGLLTWLRGEGHDDDD